LPPLHCGAIHHAILHDSEAIEPLAITVHSVLHWEWG